MKNRAIVILVIILGGLVCVSLIVGMVVYQAKAAVMLPTWKQVNADGFGDESRGLIPSLAEFDQCLYAGVYIPAGNTGEIWRTSSGENWELVESRNIFGIAAMIAYNDAIYAGSWDGWIWSSQNGITWTEGTRLVSGLYEGISRFAVYSNTLYAGTFDPVFGAEIWRTSNGTDWEEFVEGGLGDPTNSSAKASEVFRGKLYWGTENEITGAQLWRTNNITTSAVVTDGFGTPANWVVSSLAGFKDELYAGVIYDPFLRNIRVLRSPDGSDWEQVAEFTAIHGNAYNSLEVFNDQLYLVITNDMGGLQVWRTDDGLTWVQIGFAGFGDSNNTSTYWDNATTVFKDHYYVATINYSSGGEIWQMTPQTVPPASIAISGPVEGFTGNEYTFTADVEPISTTTPLTYTWQIGGQPVITATSGLSDTVVFTWDVAGSYPITVTASNGVGSIMDSHVISISQKIKKYYLPLIY